MKSTLIFEFKDIKIFLEEKDKGRLNMLRIIQEGRLGKESILVPIEGNGWFDYISRTGEKFTVFGYSKFSWEEELVAMKNQELFEILEDLLEGEETEELKNAIRSYLVSRKFSLEV